MLAMWAAMGAPCRAQQASAEIPILAQYVGRGTIFFVPDGDSAVLFSKSDANTGLGGGESSNVWVAVTAWGGRRNIRAKTEIWIDSGGRPHSLSVLKLQIEFNDALKAKAWRRNETVDSMVVETGVLDRETLSIPYTKLSFRAESVASVLRLEKSSTKALAVIDPGAAVLKEQFATHVSEKLNEAFSHLVVLHQAINAVPLMKTRYMSDSRPHKNTLDGLDRLDFDWSSLRYMGPDRYGNSRYFSDERDVPPELSVKEFVNLLGMTPAVVSDLREKEAAAAKAIGLAENLYKDLFTPP